MSAPTAQPAQIARAPAVAAVQASVHQPATPQGAADDSNSSMTPQQRQAFSLARSFVAAINSPNPKQRDPIMNRLAEVQKKLQAMYLHKHPEQAKPPPRPARNTSNSSTARTAKAPPPKHHDLWDPQFLPNIPGLPAPVKPTTMPHAVPEVPVRVGKERPAPAAASKLRRATRVPPVSSVGSPEVPVRAGKAPVRPALSVPAAVAEVPADAAEDAAAAGEAGQPIPDKAPVEMPDDEGDLDDESLSALEAQVDHFEARQRAALSNMPVGVIPKEGGVGDGSAVEPAAVDAPAARVRADEPTMKASVEASAEVPAGADGEAEDSDDGDDLELQ